MPRAFLITNKRYNSSVDYEDNQLDREDSPERGVSTAEGPLCDSETDSIGFEASSFKPTSPHSPAHQSRSLQSSPSPTRTPLAHHAVCLSPQRFSSVIFRPSQSSSGGTALATVIRQLMQQQQQQQQQPPPVLSRSSSPDSVQSNHASDVHACGECGKRYSTSSNLARHRQTHRSATDKKARRCPHCDKVYVSMPAYSMHVRTHGQGCRCPYCGKCFSRPWLLQGHIRTHTGEKPFACPVCRKAFADKSNLRAHIQTHSSAKPHVCGRCGKAFALKSYLYKHEESSCMRTTTQQQHRATHKEDEARSILLHPSSALVIG